MPTTANTDVWAKLAAPIPAGAIAWRQDGRATQRGGKYFARFVCYIEANTVRERLDAVVPGEWDLTLELLPAINNPADGDDPQAAFKARLQILGVIREDVGQGKDYKSAATDAFKRAAVRFGIGHELYDYGQNWVQVDGDGKFAKPVEEPGQAYLRRQQQAKREWVEQQERPQPTTTASTSNGSGSSSKPSTSTQPKPEPSYNEGDDIDSRAPLDDAPSFGQTGDDEVLCPKCGGRMWDNRLSKRNPKAPDYKCRERSCDGVIWPPKAGQKRRATAPKSDDEVVEAMQQEDSDDLPF